MCLRSGMIKTFRMQTIAVMLATNVTAIVLSLVMISVLLIRPAAETGANITADVVDALAQSFEHMNPADRLMILRNLDEQENLSIRVSSAAPEMPGVRPSLFGGFFLQALKQRHESAGATEWRLDDRGWFWIQTKIDEAPVWISIRTRRISDPLSGLLLVSSIALLAAIAGGIAVQRRVTLPLSALEEQVDRMESVKTLSDLDESGPREIAALSHALNRMTRRIQQTEADKAIMLAGVSHDLRSPLTKLRLSLAMLDDADTELLGTAQKQVDRIESMLGQFLEYARGFAEEPLQRVSVGKLIRSSVELADAANRVEILLQQDEEVIVKKDAFVRAIANLLANALVHGAPPVRVSATFIGDDLLLEVVDCGLGMDPDSAEALVRPFARGNSARTGDGTGLGLAIADQVAIAHGGSLSFGRSEKGFTATIQIPLPNHDAAAS